MQSFIFYFWDLLYSAVGNCSLSHVPRSKIRTTAEIRLKIGQQAAEKKKFYLFYMLFFVNYVQLQLCVGSGKI